VLTPPAAQERARHPISGPRPRPANRGTALTQASHGRSAPKQCSPAGGWDTQSALKRDRPGITH